MGPASETQLVLLLQAVEELIAERQASPEPLVRHEAEILSIFRSQLLGQMGDEASATG
jgi:hypothetical protein